MSLEELSPEMQGRIEACETAEELEKLAETEGIELSDEDLDAIAGGADRKLRIRRIRYRPLKKTRPQPQPQPETQPQNYPETALPTVDPLADNSE